MDVAPREPARGRFGKPRGRVLVVEDHPEGREMLVDFLNYEGFDVVQAADGRAALDLLEAERLPNVVLTDLRMPVLDGWSLCEQLTSRAAFRSVKVIVLTASPHENPPRDVERVIAKPVDLDELAELIAAACRSD